MGKAWEHSGQVERDNNDRRASGAKAYFYAGGTTTPAVVYQDADEATPHEFPLLADGNGRWPLVVIPFVDSYDVKVTTAGGTQLYYYRELPNPDPVQASEDTVDSTQLLQTGDWLFSPASGTRTGFVRANGRTIGSASSGATERANADVQDLYTFTWNNFADAICAVTGARGGSASADWAANKPIALHDARAAGLRGLDDMGNTAASLLAAATFTKGNATTGGSVAGENTHVLSVGEIASHTHTFSATSTTDGAHTHTGTTDSGGTHSHAITIADPGHNHTYPHFLWGDFDGTHSDVAVPTGSGGFLTKYAVTNSTSNGITASSDSTGAHTHTFTTGSGGSHSHTISGTSGSNGSGTAHNNVSRCVLGNILVKL